MKNSTIAVTSRTFSKTPELRQIAESSFGKVKFNEKGESLKGDRLVEFLEDCEGAIIALEPFTSGILSRLPKLKYLSKYGVGLNNIDQSALKALNKEVLYTKGTNKRSVAELTLSFMIGILRNVFDSIDQMSKNTWQNKGGVNLSEKTVGIIGFGNVGQDLAKILRVFDCRLLINDIVDVSEHIGPKDSLVSKKQIYQNSDIISVHTPLNEGTAAMITNRELALMKKSAVLINTARGGIIDEDHLYLALKEKRIFAAASDVFRVEPPKFPELFELPNFYGTPHIGGSSAESILSMGKAAITNLEKKLSTRRSNLC